MEKIFDRPILVAHVIRNFQKQCFPEAKITFLENGFKGPLFAIIAIFNAFDLPFYMPLVSKNDFIFPEVTVLRVQLVFQLISVFSWLG